MKNKLVIGVTGGIGAGKTAATDIFQALGITVVDADIIAREVVEIGSPALKQIESVFGKSILLENGALNRAKLRDIIFNDDTQKTRLNDIMQPAIRHELLKQLSEAQSDYVILSAPLLLESKLNQYTQRVLVIDVPEDEQIRRASKRDSVTEEQIQSIMNSQMKRSERLTLANDIIENTGSLEQLKEQIIQLNQNYLEKVKSSDNIYV